jgi:hypothetical protein
MLPMQHRSRMAIKLVLFSGPASARSHKTLLLRPLGKQLMPLYDILHEWLHLVASNLPANQSMSKLLLMARVSASEFLRAKGRSEIETECDTSQPWPSDVTYCAVSRLRGARQRRLVEPQRHRSRREAPRRGM